MRFQKFLFRLTLVCVGFTGALFIGCKGDESHESAETTVIYAPLNSKAYPDSLPLRSVLFQKADTVRLKNDKLEGCFGVDRDVKVTDDYIFVQTADDRLLMYDMNGEFIRRIGFKGRGRGEYLSIQSFDIRPGKEEIYISEALGDNILVYSFRGEFLRKIPIGNRSNNFAVKDDGHLLFLTFDANPDKGYDNGVYEADADGNFIKMIYTLPQKYISDTYRVFSHISAHEIGCMGFEDEDYIYRIKGDSVYRPYKIRTDIVMTPDQYKKRHSFRDEDAYKKDMYHETDKLLTFMIVGNSNINRIYYDKVNNRKYTLVEMSDVKPSTEESFGPFRSSYMGKFIRVLDVLNILKVPENRKAFPDITEESNPVILIFQ